MNTIEINDLNHEVAVGEANEVVGGYRLTNVLISSYKLKDVLVSS